MKGDRARKGDRSRPQPRRPASRREARVPRGGPHPQPPADTEAAIRESRARLDLALQAARMSHWEFDLQTRRVLWSAGTESLFGLAPGAFRGTEGAFYKLVHPEDRRRVAEEMTRTIETGADFESEFRTLAPDGTVRTQYAAGRLLRDAAGRPTRVIGMGTDVTDRKRAELALRESEDRFRAIAEAISAFVAVTRLDDGRILYVNDRLASFIGLPREQIIGRSVTDFYGGPDERERIRDAVARHGFVDGMEVRSRKADGTPVWVRVTARRMTFEGQPAILGTFFDLTERKLAEDSLQYRLRFESLVASLSAQFINIPLDEIDRGIQQVLQAVGEFAGADRSYVFRRSPDGATVDNTHEWYADGIPSIRAQLQGLPIAAFPWLSERLLRGEVVHVPRVADLPPEARAEREQFEREGDRSLLFVPLVYRGEILGFLGFDAVRTEKRWPEEIVALLRLVGEILVNVLMRQRTDAALQASEGKWRAVVENAPDFIATLDRQGTFLFINRTWPHHTFDQVIGSSIYNYILPEFHDRARHAIEGVFQNGSPVTLELPTQGATGVVWFHAHFGPFRYGDQPDRALVIAADITDRKRIEEAFRKSKRFLTDIFSSIQDGISILDCNLNILRVNAAHERWYAHAAPLVGKKCYAAYHGRSEPCESCPSRQTLATRQRAHQVVPKRGPGGRVEGWFDLFSFPLVDAATGEMQGVIEYVRDVTEQRRAEEALQASEKKYRVLIEQSLQGLVIAQGVPPRLVFANPAIAGIVGYSTDELLSLSPSGVRDLIHPEDRVLFFQRYQERLDGRAAPARYELRAIRKDGTVRWLEISAGRIEYGGAPAVQATFVDITERKQAEEALRYRLEFENLVTSISARFIDLPPDRIDDGIQQALQAVGGFSRVDRCYVFLRSADGASVDNTHEWCAEGIVSYREQMQSVPLSAFPWVSGQLVDGHPVHVPRVADLPPEAQAERELFQREGTRSVVTVPLVTRGVTVGLLGFDAVRQEMSWSNDTITLLNTVGQILVNAVERKRADVALRRSQALFESIFRSSQAATILSVFEDGRCVDANDAYARMTGYAREELIGRSTLELGIWYDPEERKRILAELARRRRLSGVDILVRTKAGEVLNTVASGEILQIDGRDHVLSFFFDITERKRAEEALRESARRLEEAHRRLQENQAQLVQSEKMAGLGLLAAGVAHEINNPVGFVMSNLGTLADYVGTLKRLLDAHEALAAADTEAARAAARARLEAARSEEDLPFLLKDVDNLLRESLDGTRRVKEIVQALRSFARPDDGERMEANLNEGIEATLKVVWNEIKYKCRVVKRLAPLPSIPCYPGQINQVFLNLILNAAQAIPEQGEITIETKVEDGHVLVRISDTGVGISPENLPKLFSPFFSTKPVGKGTGLGLSISYGIVRKHNGTIEAVSEVGKGTTFTIKLPLRGVDHA